VPTMISGAAGWWARREERAFAHPTHYRSNVSQRKTFVDMGSRVRGNDGIAIFQPCFRNQLTLP
jgi:hypothetical protein